MNAHKTKYMFFRFAFNRVPTDHPESAITAVHYLSISPTKSILIT